MCYNRIVKGGILSAKQKCFEFPPLGGALVPIKQNASV